MTDQLPEPLVPAGVDLRDFAFMPLEINRLRKSKAWLWAKREPALGFYMLNLWSTSWHETPAASLEDDDDVLADAAMCDLKMWPKVKDKVLHGWVKCSDGRLYHPIVAEKALEAWAAKTKQRQRTANATKARQATPTYHNLNKEHRDVDRDVARNDVASEQRNEQRDDDVTFTKGRDREGKGQGIEVERATRAGPAKGTRWPPDKVVPEDWLADADIQRHEHELPRIDLRLEATRFANYWAAKSGGTAAKLDWHRTWINWALGAEKGNGTGRRTSAKPAGPNWGAIGEFAREDSQDPRGDSARAAQSSAAGPTPRPIAPSGDGESGHQGGAGSASGAAGSHLRLAAIERGRDVHEIPDFLLRARPSA